MVIKLVDQQQTSYQLVIWGGEASFQNMVTGQPSNYYNDDIIQVSPEQPHTTQTN